MARRREEASSSSRSEEDAQRVERRHDAAAVAALVGAHLLFFWRAALLRGFLVHSDICYQFEPYKALLHEALSDNRLALWSPYIFAGYPIAAEGQIAAFYPVSLLLSWLLPSPAAVNWLIILHLMLAGVSSYALGRLLGLRPFAAWLSGIILSFSGYLFAHIHHVGLVCTAAWLPTTLFFLERAWRGPLVRNAALAAIAVGAAALAGHPQTLFHIALVSILLVAWRLVGSVRSRAPHAYRRAVVLLALALGLGMGVAAVQVLLTADLALAAPHGETGQLSYITSFSLLPRHLLGLFAPNWQGTPAYNTYQGERYYWEYVLYLGLVPLGLAVVGAGTRGGRPFAVFAVLALVLALARGNPLYSLLRFVPGFAHFRAPARFVYLFALAAALLAGYGWEAIARRQRMGRRNPLLAMGFLIALATAADLFYLDRTLAPLAAPHVYAATPKVVQVLKADSEWGRSLIIPPIAIYADWLPAGGWAANPDGYLDCRIYLPADVPQSFGLRTLGGYAGFTNPSHAIFFQGAAAQAFQSHDYRLLSLVGTRYLVAGHDIRLPNLPAADAPPFLVYRNAAAFPRAFVVGEAVPAAAEGAGVYLQTLELAKADRLHEAAVVGGDLMGFRPDEHARAELTIEEPRPEHVIVHARADRNALLVLNERWDPGWRARVDGQPAPLVEVDAVLMGAPLPAGEHTVEFLYQPRGLIVGRAISAISLVVCAALVLLPSLTGRRGAASR